MVGSKGWPVMLTLMSPTFEELGTDENYWISCWMGFCLCLLDRLRHQLPDPAAVLQLIAGKQLPYDHRIQGSGGNEIQKGI